MCVKGMIIGCAAVLLCVAAVCAEPVTADPTDVSRLLGALHGSNATELPQIVQTDAGFVRFVSAPPGASLSTSTTTKAAAPEDTALSFMTQHEGAFSTKSSRMGYEVAKTINKGEHVSVKLKQQYGSLPVFGAHAVVQLDGNRNVSSVLTDILRDTSSLDQGLVRLVPGISMNDAQRAAMDYVASLDENFDRLYLMATPPELMLYAPTVVGSAGPVQLVWRTVVSSFMTVTPVQAVLVDATTGNIAFSYSLVYEEKRRFVYDADNTESDPGTLVRSEGQAPCEITDADNAYDFLGETYDFYYLHHQRDGIDGAGERLSATVRYCEWYMCPMYNAFYSPSNDRAYFGDRYVTDDVVPHELTHGVTSYESGLIYWGESGAINEAFSDSWGEFIDLTDGTNDDENDAWIHGEDLPRGPNRSLINPPDFKNDLDYYGQNLPMPDRYRGPGWYTGYGDNAGVHHNSGVGNKLAFLLSDWQLFNNRLITGIGIDRTADLFYKVQTSYLTEASDYHDLGVSLYQAAADLGYSVADRDNVARAIMAVGIASFQSQPARHFRALPYQAPDKTTSSIFLRWDEALLMSASTPPVVVRRTDRFPTCAEDVMPGGPAAIPVSNVSCHTDCAVADGTEYFYGFFASYTDPANASTVVNTKMLSRATAGAPLPNTWTEAFDASDGQPIDLAFSQLLFSPNGDPADALASGSPGDYAGFSNYTATIARGISTLPVPKSDANGHATRVAMTEDGMYSVSILPTPFLGLIETKLYFASNGYITAEPVSSTAAENFPSLASHFETPRFSFLFADLAHSISGETWIRQLSDRLVITYEKVPEWPTGIVYTPAPNTVQVELFTSGHIRVTYLELNLEQVVVGISDGRGVPRDPGESADAQTKSALIMDLSEDLPEGVASTLTLWPPIPVQVAEEGDIVSFDVTTQCPAGTPVLSATWGSAGPAAPFADHGNGTGTFEWPTTLDSDGAYSVRVTARYGDIMVFQDVVIVVSDKSFVPTASDLWIWSEDMEEDAPAAREVSTHSRLEARYAYSHPQAEEHPEQYAEGSSSIRWYRNNIAISYLDGQLIVPATVTRAGERWFFTIVPQTVFGIQGREMVSPVIVITDPSVIELVSPALGIVTGGTSVTITGQTLDRPSAVTFGGIAASSFRSLSATQIEAVTPAHMSGYVDVSVTTPTGVATVPAAFLYIVDADKLLAADVNGNGVVDAADIQLVINVILNAQKSAARADVNQDGDVNSADIQEVINAVLFQ